MNEREKELMAMLRQTAPGTALRSGLDNVLKANTGGLIVIADEETLAPVTVGGFKIDAPYTPAHLYELAKMDGAILLQPESYRIMAANVHLTPNPETTSRETGIRHRTAEQTAKQTEALVISISQRRNVISLYKGNLKAVLREPGQLLTMANQALATMDKYRMVLGEALLRLSVEEFDDIVSLSSVVQVIQRAELVTRIEWELNAYVVELGNEGRLIKMQLDELTSNVIEDEMLTIRDYLIYDEKDEEFDLDDAIDEVLSRLHRLTTEDLFNRLSIAKLLGYSDDKNEFLRTRGYRILNRIPRLPSNVIDNLIEHFEDFATLNLATVEMLDEVDGVGQKRAEQIRVGLERLRTQTISDSHWA